jgi:hypothetical protein
MLLGYQIKENEIGRDVTRMKRSKCSIILITKLKGGGNLVKRDVNEGIILKLVLKQMDAMNSIAGPFDLYT